MPPVSDYVGDTHETLYEYLNKCWATHVGNRLEYRSPYVAIVQSVGFGKTRVLRELALRYHLDDQHDPTTIPPAVAPQSAPLEYRRRLVYVNVRTSESSGVERLLTSNFTRKKNDLAEYFFTSSKKTTSALANELADRLVRLFKWVMQADQSSDTAATIDKTLVELFAETNGSLAGTLRGAEDRAKREELPAASTQTATTTTGKPRHQVLVFAVDEASALVPRTPQDDDTYEEKDWFRILRCALDLANSQIQYSSRGQFSTRSGILALLVDADASIAMWVPPPQPPPMLDSSSRRFMHKPLALLPPFVLAHTMDVFRHMDGDAAHVAADHGAATTSHAATTLAQYQTQVTQALVESYSSDVYRRASWKQLRLLGRPLWLRVQSNRLLAATAARMLLGGVWTLVRASLDDQTLHGVAALLCRVGIRPHASATALATRLVKHGMAVLSYIASDRQTMVVSYASDPILTLGATLLWHMEGGCGSMLADEMLPQLRKLVRQEMVVVMDGSGSHGSLGSHGIDMVVARIVLLLAMDACDLLERGPSETDYWGGAGEFVSVWTFLRALHGDKVAVQQRQVVDDDDEDDDAVASLLTASVASCWSKWKVSFTHFVELDDLPSQASLWAMLGRRAAGIVPRRGLPIADDQQYSTVDLVIPICTVEGDDDQQQQDHLENPTVRVSMIVVQVQSVTQIHEQQWANTPLFPDPVLRICMSPRSEQVQRFYVEVPVSDGQSSSSSLSSSSSYVLCLEGLGPLSVCTLAPGKAIATSSTAASPTTAAASTVDVLTPAVVEQLQKLCVPSWGTMRTLVEQDLESQETETRKPGAGKLMRWSEMEKSELLRVVSKTTAEGLLLQGNGGDGDDQQQQQQSRCGSVNSADSTPMVEVLPGDRKRSMADIEDVGVDVAGFSEDGSEEEDEPMAELGGEQSAKSCPRVKKTKVA